MSSFGQGWDGACPAQWLCQLLQQSQAEETPMTPSCWEKHFKGMLD